MMPDIPAPLSPEEVAALESMGISLSERQLIATVRDRERQMDTALRTIEVLSDTPTGRAIASGLEDIKAGSLRALDCVHGGCEKYKLEAERDELQRQLDEMRKASLDAERRLKAVPESLLCDQRDPCSYDHTCRIHKALAELRRIAEGKDG